jgi:hypothetical protein
MSYIKKSFDVNFSSDPANGAVNRSADGSTFTVELEGNGLGIPRNATNVNLQVVNSELWWNTPNIVVGQNANFRYTFNGTYFTAVIPTGLYSVNTLNDVIDRETSNAGYTGLFTLEPDVAQGKVQITFKYISSIDFSYNQTFGELLGFLPQVYTTTTAGEVIVGPNTAKFSNTSYFLIQSDITNQGLLFNGTYDSIIAKVLITSQPGSQLLYQPVNPTLIDAINLIGDRRRRYQFSLLTNTKERADTNGEYWSVQLRISYYEPVNFNVVG